MQGSNEGHLPLKVVFQQRMSSTEGCLPQNVVFHQRSSSTEGRLPLKIVFQQRLPSTESRLPPKVVFHQRSSSNRGRLLPKVVFHQMLSSTYHNTCIHLIFVRAVNIPNLSFLPAMHDAWSMKLDAWCMMYNGTPKLILNLWKQSTYQISASYLA